MPQQPTSANPYVIKSAKGLNDHVSPVKIESGFISTGINELADGQSYDRRKGRALFWLSDEDPILSIYPVTWGDGTINYIAQAGDNYFDITPTYSFYFRDGARIIMQAPGGQYWDVTPGFTTGLIDPIIVSTPSTAAQTESFTVTNTETIAFQIDGASVELLSDFQNNGWYLMDGLDELGFTQFTSDVVFTYASGLSLIIQDSALNNWKFSVSDIGELIVTTI